jgi:predicted nucleic acid-binding protein
MAPVSVGEETRRGREGEEGDSSGKKKLPDAIIAATALVYDLTLLSRNSSDFSGINGLKIINPWGK